MSERKVLVITYYWPPSGGSGVQRWLKFVKYLPEFGWIPYVFTPENPAFAIQDQSLLKDVPPEAEVIHMPIWEPYNAFFKFSTLFGHKKKSAKPTDLILTSDSSLFQKISTWIRGNFFIPDPRIFWVGPSVSFLSDFISENRIRTVITTGPPHSMHLIGYRLKRKIPSIRWIADFRDPWTQWGLLNSLKVGSLARIIHRRLESKVLTTADTILTITPFYAKQLGTLAQRRVTLLTNGFDEDDFKGFVIEQTDKFIIRHVGLVNEKCNPRPFMHAIKELLSEQPDFGNDVKIEFTGEVHPLFKEFVFKDTEILRVTSFPGNVSHDELINLYGRSSVLLLILTGYKDAEGFLPGKLFEYLATGLPVLAIGPTPSDASLLLEETNAGVMIGDDDTGGIKKQVMIFYQLWKSAGMFDINRTAINIYSRRAKTRELTEILNN